MHYTTFSHILSRVPRDAEGTYGKPTTIRVYAEYICIGTSLGAIRIFDFGEQLITTLVNRKVGKGVTCLAVS